MKTDTPRTDEFEALRDAMSTRASADYVSALQLCDELERELTAVTYQRDRLAELLRKLDMTLEAQCFSPTGYTRTEIHEALEAVGVFHAYTQHGDYDHE